MLDHDNDNEMSILTVKRRYKSLKWRFLTIFWFKTLDFVILTIYKVLTQKMLENIILTTYNVILKVKCRHFSKNDGFELLNNVKMMFSTNICDRRSNITNVRTSGKASLVYRSRIVDVDNHAFPWCSPTNTNLNSQF